jgi:hypothetical protein
MSRETGGVGVVKESIGALALGGPDGSDTDRRQSYGREGRRR